MNREAELDRPSRVACSDLLGVVIIILLTTHASDNDQNAKDCTTTSSNHKPSCYRGIGIMLDSITCESPAIRGVSRKLPIIITKSKKPTAHHNKK